MATPQTQTRTLLTGPIVQSIYERLAMQIHSRGAGFFGGLAEELNAYLLQENEQDAVTLSWRQFKELDEESNGTYYSVAATDGNNQPRMTRVANDLAELAHELSQPYWRGQTVTVEVNCALYQSYGQSIYQIDPDGQRTVQEEHGMTRGLLAAVQEEQQYLLA